MRITGKLKYFVFACCLAAGLLVTHQSYATNRDAIIDLLYDITKDAMQYYLRPLEKEGGGNSFAGFTIPEKYQRNPIAAVNTVFISKDSILFFGIGLTDIKDGDSLLAHTAKVTRVDNFSIFIKTAQTDTLQSFDYMLPGLTAQKDSIITMLNHLAEMAIEYCLRPTYLGGGGNSFDGFVIPSGLAANSKGRFIVQSINPESVIINGSWSKDISGNLPDISILAIVTIKQTRFWRVI